MPSELSPNYDFDSDLDLIYRTNENYNYGDLFDHDLLTQLNLFEHGN